MNRPVSEALAALYRIDTSNWWPDDRQTLEATIAILSRYRPQEERANR